MPSSKRFHFSHIFISLEFTTLLVLCYRCRVRTCAYSPTFSTGMCFIFWRLHDEMFCFLYCLVALSWNISCANSGSSSFSKGILILILNSCWFFPENAQRVNVETWALIFVFPPQTREWSESHFIFPYSSLHYAYLNTSSKKNLFAHCLRGRIIRSPFALIVSKTNNSVSVLTFPRIQSSFSFDAF